MENGERHDRFFKPVCFGLLLAVLIAYAPVLRCDFVNFDTTDYVTHNPHVQQGLMWSSVKWAFTAGHASNWHPLTWISHMLDSEFFGMNPAMHHAVNLAFHAANTLLLFLILLRMTGHLWKSAFVAAVFGLHPLHVESVAWVAERKDVLSTFFWMLTVWAYVRFVENMGRNARFSRRWYAAAVGFYALGLMSKPMVVTLPFVLLLLDWWPLQRISNVKFGIQNEESGAVASGKANPGASFVWRRWAPLVTEKIPFFGLSAALSVVTYWVQAKTGAVQSSEMFPLGMRLANALVSYAAYIGKTIWPTDLSVFYPYRESVTAWQVAGAVSLLAAITGIVLWQARRRAFLPVGWFWFLGMLVPVIGLVQAGQQAMADRYMYLPMVGLLVIIAWGVPALVAASRILSLSMVKWIAMAAVLACIPATQRQARVWANSGTLFQNAIAIDSGNAIAHTMLGGYLESQGRFEQAEAHYRAAAKINPAKPQMHYNIGNICMNRGNFDEAEIHFLKALELWPDFPRGNNNLGYLRLQQGRTNEAVESFKKSASLKPDLAEAQRNLAVALITLSRYDEAHEHVVSALEHLPDDAILRHLLANVLALQGRPQEAVVEYQRCLDLKPDDPQAHFNFANTLARLGNLDRARWHYREALRLRPDYQEARLRLGSMEQAD